MRVVTWSATLPPLGACVMAIGVFDGVHRGHQALLADAVADAAARGVPAVVVTFDRDPDQVVSPATAAPQLLTLADKERFVADAGVDAILVVPFTQELASQDADAFVDAVLCSVATPLAVHVGRDFRFGRGASGNVTTLRSAADRCGWNVVAHDLVANDGAPVTSTRVRLLVAEGRVDVAAALLGRPTRVAGLVHHGRGEGAALGFPTANVVPAAYAALPSDGVYAGRAVLATGSIWPAAIAVGTPPSFPEARDYLEAHLVGFTGNLYDSPITLEFLQRLRDQRGYPSLDALKAAISADVAQTLDINESADLHRDEGCLSDGLPVVDDPGALEAAEAAAMMAPGSFDQIATGDWVPVLEELHFDSRGAEFRAASVTASLESADVPYAWDPYPPEKSAGAVRGALTRPFTLLVPAQLFTRAVGALRDAGVEPAHVVSVPTSNGWSVLVGGLSFDRQRLTALDAALDSGGIEHLWHPYAPQEAPLLRLGIFGTERFSISVPSEQIDSAHALLEGLGQVGSGSGEE